MEGLGTACERCVAYYDWLSQRRERHERLLVAMCYARYVSPWTAGELVTLVSPRLGTMPTRLTWDRWPVDAVAAARDWTPDAGGVWVHGSTGTGKTTLARAVLVRAALDHGRTVGETAASQLVRAYDRYGQDEQLRYLERCGVLLLDDLDKCRWTAATIDHLFSLLDARVTARRVTLVTSNCTPAELATTLAKRTDANTVYAALDRLRPFAAVALTGTSMRGE